MGKTQEERKFAHEAALQLFALIKEAERLGLINVARKLRNSIGALKEESENRPVIEQEEGEKNHE